MSNTIHFVSKPMFSCPSINSIPQFPNSFLRSLRLSRGLSQSQLASAIGVSRNAISSYERGEYKPSFDVLVKLLNFFEV